MKSRTVQATLLATMCWALCLAGQLPADEKDGAAPSLAGEWRAILPLEFVQPTILSDLGQGKYGLRSRANVFNGIYLWREGKLSMVEPIDERMKGLVWKGDGKLLRLIEEPKDTPTGASYVGTTLTRAEE
jgi:hypothetical protein